VFVYVGLLPWTYFANAVTGAGNSLVGSANLITKVYFPRLMIPAAVVMGGLLDLLLGIPVLLLLMAWYGIPPSLTLASLLALPALAVLTSLLAFGIGLGLAALNARYRDVRYAIPFLVQIWMFVTPVVYPLDLAPERARWLIALNPMAGVVEGWRAAFLGTPMPADALGAAILAAAVLLLCGLFYFQRVERTLADVV
jgi:lipopolysaccharide transport system permease protein